MAIQAEAGRPYCAFCHISFGTHEPRQDHKGEKYHEDCWKKKRQENLRSLVRIHSRNLVPIVVRRHL